MYYRNFDYKLATHNHVFSLSGEVIKNERIGLFLVGQMSYFKEIFAYNNMATITKLKELEIILPVKDDNTIDFDFMEKYILAIQKLVIKDVVDFKNNQLQLMTKAVQQ